MRMLALTWICAMAVGSVGCGKGSAPKGYSIAVIPKGTTHEFWKAVHAGAVQAARELTASGTVVTVTWKGPLREDDREQQIQVVENFASQGINGLVLAPLDDRALVRPVEEAKRAGVPTVIIDSDLASDSTVSFVATDNGKGGELAAERLGSLLGGKGKVLLLRYQEGSASTRAREEGFTKKLKESYSGIELISSDQYAGPTRETAKRAAENLLNRFGDQLNGVFTPNETSTEGMLLALQDAGRAGKILLVGFDVTTGFLEAIRVGQLQGIVVQNPFRIGYLGVKTMVAHLRGEPVERRVDTGVVLVTLENMAQPNMQAILHPPVDSVLNAGR